MADITTSTIQINDGASTVNGNLNVTGDLTVGGTNFIVNTTTVEVKDNILQLNTTPGSPDTATATTSGISIYRGDAVTQASLIFDDADDTWDLTNNLVVGGAITATGGTLTGNLGVGISPTYRLHVYHPTTNVIATIESGDATAHINLKDNASDTYGILLSATGNDFHVSTGSAVGSGLTERLRISGSTGVITADGGTSTNWNAAYNYSQVGHLPLSGGAVNGNVSITGTNGAVAFVVNSTHTPSVNANRSGAQINFDISDAGAALTADRVYAALDINTTSNVSGGDLSNEARIYGINTNVIATSDEDLALGILGVAGRQAGVGQTANTSIMGVEGIAYMGAGVDNAEVVTELIGLYGYAYASNSDGTNPNVITSYGVLGKYLNVSGGLGAVVTAAYGGYFEVENDIGTITNAYGVRAVIDRDGGTTQNGYLFYGDFQGTIAGNKYGLWIAGETNNYLSGNVGIGVTSPTTKLDVNGVITATGGTSTQWNTAYSWGDHADNLYLPIDGKAADSELLDGIDSTQFLRSDVADTMGAQLTINSGSFNPLKLDRTSASNVNMSFYHQGVLKGYLGIGSTGDLSWGLNADSALNNTIIHAGNIANQSVANASTLDSLDSTQFLRSDESDTMTGSLTVNGSGVGITATSSQNTGLIVDGGTNSDIIAEFKNSTTKAVINTSGGGYFLGSVGIGVTAPAVKLHAVGTIEEVIRVESGATGAIHFFNGTTRTGILGYSDGTSIATAADADDMVLRSETGHKLHLSISSVVGATLTSTGFGIGTISPSRPLEVNGSAYVNGEFLAAPSGIVRINQYDNGLTGAGEIALYSLAGTGWNTGDGLGRIRFYTSDTSGIGARDVAKIEAVSEDGNGTTSTTPSGALAFYTSLYNANVVESMRITSTGFVGIGTNSPTAKLNVSGVSTGAAIDWTNTTATTGRSFRWVSLNAGGFAVEDLTASGANRFTINASGDVGIGTTSPIADGLTIRREGSDRKVLLKLDRPNIAGLQTAMQFTVGNIMVGQIQHEYVASNYNHMSFTLRAVNGSDIIPLWLENSGNVGIGTTSPIDKVHIDGGLTSTGLSTPSNTSVGSLQIGYDGTNGVIRTWNSSPLLFSAYNYYQWDVSGSAAMYISTSRNVGIGTTSPSERLTVNGNLKVGTGTVGDENIQLHYANGVGFYGALRFYEGGSNNQTIHAFSSLWQGGNAYSASSGCINVNGANGVTFGPWNNVDVVFQTGSTSYFKNSVGIGVTAPVSKLQVAGDILPSADNTGVIGNTDYTWADGQFTNLSVNSTLTVTSTLNVRAAIDLADSDVLRFGSSDDAYFVYNGTSNFFELQLEAAATDFRITDNGTTRFTFAKSGGTFTATGDVVAYSDIRVKENIETIDNALDKVMSMRGVSYNRTDNDDKTKKVGVIAQEIQKVLPEVVQENSDGMLGVSYGNIVGVLIEAIKEQQKQIDELKAMIKNNSLT